MTAARRARLLAMLRALLAELECDEQPPPLHDLESRLAEIRRILARGLVLDTRLSDSDTAALDAFVGAIAAACYTACTCAPVEGAAGAIGRARRDDCPQHGTARASR